jgi:hypothetical protein
LSWFCCHGGCPWIQAKANERQKDANAAEDEAD